MRLLLSMGILLVSACSQNINTNKMSPREIEDQFYNQVVLAEKQSVDGDKKKAKKSYDQAAALIKAFQAHSLHHESKQTWLCSIEKAGNLRIIYDASEHTIEDFYRRKSLSSAFAKYSWFRTHSLQVQEGCSNSLKSKNLVQTYKAALEEKWSIKYGAEWAEKEREFNSGFGIISASMKRPSGCPEEYSHAKCTWDSFEERARSTRSIGQPDIRKCIDQTVDIPNTTVGLSYIRQACVINPFYE